MPKRTRWVFFPYRTKWMFHHRRHPTYHSYSAKGGPLDVFDHPCYPCVSGNDLFFCDRDDDFVQKRTADDLLYLSHIGTHGTGNDQFNEPLGICCVGDHLFITDRINSRIVKRLKEDLSYVAQTSGAAFPNHLYYPEGICSDGTYLYVCDTYHHRIQKYALDFSFVSQIGSEGTGDDQFKYPKGIAVCNGYLFITDTNNNRIVKRLASDLSFVAKIGVLDVGGAGGNDGFWQPQGVACDSIDHIYVCDTANDRIHKRKADDLSYVDKVGAHNSGVFDFPHGIAYSNGYLYIGDGDNHRIVKRKASDLSYVSEVGAALEGTPANGTSWVTLLSKRATSRIFIYAIQLTTYGAWVGDPKFRILYNSHKLYPDVSEADVDSGVFTVFPAPLYVHRNLTYTVQFRSTSAADVSPKVMSLDRLSVSHYGPWR